MKKSIIAFLLLFFTHSAWSQEVTWSNFQMEWCFTNSTGQDCYLSEEICKGDFIHIVNKSVLNSNSTCSGIESGIPDVNPGANQGYYFIQISGTSPLISHTVSAEQWEYNNTYSIQVNQLVTSNGALNINITHYGGDVIPCYTGARSHKGYLDVVQPQQVSAQVNPSIICPGEIATLTASGSETYSWSTGQNGQSIDVTPNVTSGYEVFATDINGCATSVEIEVPVHELPPLNLQEYPLCQKQPIPLLDAGPNMVSYEWYEASNPSTMISTQQTYQPTVYGSYCVEITDQNGCINSGCFGVFEHPTAAYSADFGVDQNPGPNNTLDIEIQNISVVPSSTHTSSWKIEEYNSSGTLVNTINNPWITWISFPTEFVFTYATFYQGVEYHVIRTIASNDGCLRSKKVTNVVNYGRFQAGGGTRKALISAPSGIKDMQIEVFPNPSSGVFHLRSDNEVQHIAVVDPMGRIILESSPIGLNEIKIDLSNQSAGVFFLKVQIADRLEVIQIKKNN